MAIKEIYFSDMIGNLTYGASLGGVRFYDENGNLIPTGLFYTDDSKLAESNTMKIESSHGRLSTNYSLAGMASTLNVAVPTSQRQTFLTTSKSNPLRIIFTFKTFVKGISRIDFVPRPTSNATTPKDDRGITSPFWITIYNDNGNYVSSEQVTPITQTKTVQTYIAPDSARYPVYNEFPRFFDAKLGIPLSGSFPYELLRDGVIYSQGNTSNNGVFTNLNPLSVYKIKILAQGQYGETPYYTFVDDGQNLNIFLIKIYTKKIYVRDANTGELVTTPIQLEMIRNGSLQKIVTITNGQTTLTDVYEMSDYTVKTLQSDSYKASLSYSFTENSDDLTIYIYELTDTLTLYKDNKLISSEGVVHFNGTVPYDEFNIANLALDSKFTNQYYLFNSGEIGISSQQIARKPLSIRFD